MSRENLDCLKRKRDICVKAVITSQNTAFMLTPALTYLAKLDELNMRTPLTHFGAKLGPVYKEGRLP